MAASPFQHVLRDVAYAARTLRRRVSSTATAVVILALGIGANTTVFRFVSALLLQPPVLPPANPPPQPLRALRPQKPPPRVARGVLAKYARCVHSASEGAITS